MARRVRLLAISAVVTVGLVGASAVQVTAAGQVEYKKVTASQRKLLQAGLQTVPKAQIRATQKVGGVTVQAANPWLANLTNPQDVDWSYWKQQAQVLGKERAKSAQLQRNKLAASGLSARPPLVHDEQEPDGTAGSNDIQANAEPIAGFGTGAGDNNAVRVLGSLAESVGEVVDPSKEDDGSIPLATDTGVSDQRLAITTTGVLGDGPHGPAGDGSNDYDVYAMNLAAGEPIQVSTDSPDTDADTIVALYGANGSLLAADDDGGAGLTSLLSYRVAKAGTYYAFVMGFSPDPLPADPRDSGSGSGDSDTGNYGLTIAAQVDQDYFGVDLRKGDVLGGSIAGAATRLVVHRTDRKAMIGSEQDASSLYPPTSPLPGGGNAVVAYVAEQSGRYAVSVENGTGRYDLTLEVYRPGPVKEAKVQTVFLDFDGARVNTGIFGGPGVRTLSPFGSFIGRWGLSRAADESALITAITARVTENIKSDLVRKGLSDRVAVRVLNSRDDADPFGQPDVSRVIIGGTIDQSGIGTIGIAQYIDPGNFGNQDSALVLLDVLSDPAAGFGDPSINSYLKAASDKRAFVAQVVGNITSHEAGHFIGSYHVDQFNDVYNLMDQGGNFPLLYGVGPDRVGGTADDVDVDFGEDTYNPFEGFTGTEDTLNVSAWAFSRPFAP